MYAYRPSRPERKPYSLLKPILWIVAVGLIAAACGILVAQAITSVMADASKLVMP